MHAARPARPFHICSRRATATVAALVTGLLLIAGCGSSDDSQSAVTNVPTVSPATAVPAPPGPPTTPAGVIIPTPAGASSLTLSGDRVAVLGPEGTSVLRYDTAARDAAPTTVTTPRLRTLMGTGQGAFVGAGPGVVVRVSPDGTTTTAPLDTDSPSALARTPDGRILVGTGDGHVLVLDKDLKSVNNFGGFVRVDDITVSGPGADLSSEQVVILDRAQSSVTPIDLSDGKHGPSLRAGNGATTSTVDRYGRVLVANTRDNEILGFFGSPLVMRFRYPVPDGPYAVDYDNTRNVLWVSTTGDNTATAYDLAGGEPVEKQRFATVAQPDSLIVDGAGTVYVLSARDGGIQVVDTRAPTENPPVGPTIQSAP